MFGERVQEIVEGLSTALDATIDLIDLIDGTDRHHVLMRSGRWLAVRTVDHGATRLRGTSTLRVPINARWTLRIFKKGPLHHDAETLAGWAARRLGAELPETERDDTAFPPVDGTPVDGTPVDGGGGSESAGIGIRAPSVPKTRN
jgi:hypothetical protein